MLASWRTAPDVTMSTGIMQLAGASIPLLAMAHAVPPHLNSVPSRGSVAPHSGVCHTVGLYCHIERDSEITSPNVIMLQYDTTRNAMLYREMDAMNLNNL